MFWRFSFVQKSIRLFAVVLLLLTGNSAGVSAAPSLAATQPQALHAACSLAIGQAIYLPLINTQVSKQQPFQPATVQTGVRPLIAPLAEDPETADAQSSPGQVQVDCVDLNQFNPLTTPVEFTVTGASFSETDTTVMITNNDIVRSTANGLQVTRTGNTIRVENLLVDGRNVISFLAVDENGLTLSAATTVYAGDNTLTVSVTDTNNLPVDGAVVTASVGEKQEVVSGGVTSGGQVVFVNVPDVTILLKAAVTAGNQIAVAGVVGSDLTATLKLKGFDPPSTIKNNDFSLGLDGWNVGTAPVTLIAHEETAPTAVAAQADMDLQVATAGEGAQSVSRTFTIEEGVEEVTVRYRFITTEVPGGYFGTKYNDYFSVQIRGLNGGGVITESNSMNGLGLGAFDGSGATGWREASLPVNQAGDTIQADISVANVSDALLDSFVVVDLVAEKKLKVTVDKDKACVNQTVTFTGDPAGDIQWSGGGNPATGSGATFVTRFSDPGDKSVTGTLTTTSGTSSDSASVHIKEPSGVAWVARFPQSRNLSDLSAGFQTSVSNFISALQAAGASVTINSTYRPPERAYLMHYAFKVANNQISPSAVPDYAGVDICWQHYDSSGNPDDAASRSAAAAMVAAYDIAYAPALVSRHTQREAIDMNISWTGDLTIVDGNGNSVTITSTPRTGAGNTDLHNVGATYGANKLPADPPHWSSDGH